jgi:hypothetical protein
VENILADVASRAIPAKFDWKVENSSCHNSPPNTCFLTYFAARFPLPQTCSWQIVTPTPELLSNVISTLRGQRLQMQRWILPPERPRGESGANMPTMCAISTPSSGQSLLSSNNKVSWPLPPGFELDALGMVGKLDTKPSKKPYVTWAKPKFWQDSSPTPEGDMAPKS